MWYANESDSRKRNGGAWAPEGSGKDRRASSRAGESQSHQIKNPPTPGNRGGGCQVFRSGRRGFRGGDVCNSPEREGDLPEVTSAPLAPAAATSQPTPGAPPPAHSSFCPLLTSTRGGISRPKPHRPASRCTPRQVHPMSVARRRPPPRPPHGPRGAHASHPAAELTRPGVFPRSFSCSPRRLSRGGQLCSLHLPVRSPPSSHRRRSPDLAGEGGPLEMKGAPQKAEGEAARPGAGG